VTVATPKTERLVVLVTPETLELLRARATQRTMSVGAVVRWAINKELRQARLRTRQRRSA
jgi:hypothetical protein